MGPSLRTYVGATVVGASLCAAIVHSAPKGMPFRKLPTVEQAHTIYAEAVAREPEERLKAEGEFRGSPWSQDDDFHNKESKQAKDYAKSHKVNVGGVLDAVDEGMRAHWATPTNNVPNPKVMPCRPRLSY